MSHHHSLFFSLLLLAVTSLAQHSEPLDSFNTEFYHKSENDIFLIVNVTDKDYTYGEIVGVRKKAKKQNLFVFSKKAKSYLNEFEMGLMAYTPNYKAKDFDPDNNTDRPFAGWIYGQYGQHYVFKRSIFFSGLQIGSLGPNARAGKLQNWYHTSFGLGRFIEGWDTQIPNTLGVNFIQRFAHSLKETKKSNLYLSAKSSIGNIFTFVESRFGLSFGKNSGIFSFSRLANTQHTKNIFFDFNLGGRYTLYDASLQGNLFKENTFVQSNQINQFTITGSTGMRYLNKRWLVNLLVYFQSNALKSFSNHRYGSVEIAYSIL